LNAVLAEDASTCGELEVFLGLLLDGELDDDERREVEAHVSSCPRCQRELKLLEKTRAHLRHHADGPAAPAALAERIHVAIGDEARRERSTRARRASIAVAAGVLLVVGGVGLTFSLRSSEAPPGAASENDRASRVLNATRVQHELELPVDVASADPARVERYLRARVGHSIEVPRLEGQGFALRGGRVVAVEDRSAAQLVYQGGLGHRLSVTVLPDVDDAVAEAAVAPGVGDRREDAVPLQALKVGRSLYTLAGDVPVEVLRAVSADIAAQAR